MKKYLTLISTVLLLAACTAEPQESTDSQSSEVDRSEPSEQVESSEPIEESESVQENAETTEPKEWLIDQSSGFWDGSGLTLDQDEATLTFPLPETRVLSSTTFELVQEEDYSATEDIKKYEVFVPEGVNYEGEAEPFQNDLFESEEVDGGTLFTSVDLEDSENYNYLAPQSLHIYETHPELLELVVFDEFSAFILAFPEDETEEEYQEISLAYDAVHDNLKLMTLPGITLAQDELEKISDFIPDSQLVPFHQELIDQATAYFEAESEADSEAMEAALSAMSEIRYANLKGVFDNYLAYHQNVTPAS